MTEFGALRPDRVLDDDLQKIPLWSSPCARLRRQADLRRPGL